MVNVWASNERSSASRATPASSHRMTRSSPWAKMSIFGIQALEWVRPSWGWSTPARQNSRIRLSSATVSNSPWKRWCCSRSTMSPLAYWLPPAIPGCGAVLSQGFEEADRQADHHERERRSGDDRRLLQRVQPPGDQQRDRHAAHRRAPERDDRARRLEDAAAGQHAYHDRRRVGAADEEHRDKDDHDD